MVHFPKTIKIGRCFYDIKFVKGLKKREGVYGDIDEDDEIIRIDKDLSWELKMKTLIHEYIHGANCEMREKTVLKLEKQIFDLFCQIL